MTDAVTEIVAWKGRLYEIRTRPGGLVEWREVGGDWHLAGTRTDALLFIGGHARHTEAGGTYA